MDWLKDMYIKAKDLQNSMNFDDLYELRNKDTLVGNYADEIFGSLANILNTYNNTSTSNFGRSDALHLITQFQNIELGIKAIDNHSPSDVTLASRASSVKNWISNTFLPKMKGLGAHIMSTIANLSTPKEWTLKGKISSFSLGGLEVEIKF